MSKLQSAKLEKNLSNTLNISGFFIKYGVIIVFIILCIIFGFLSPNFLTINNFKNILVQSSVLAITGCGLTVVMACGGFDLTLGSVLSFTGVIAALTMYHGYGTVTAIIVAILGGLLVGIINSVLILGIGLPDFIATLGMMFLFQGISLTLTQGMPVWTGFKKSFAYIGNGFIGPLPVAVIIAIFIGIIIHVYLKHTQMGRNIYAIGGNKEAAWLSGINIKLYRSVAFILAGIINAIAGIVLAARLSSGQPTAGDSFLLTVIAAVYIGMTILSEGEPHILGTCIGAIILGTIENALVLLNVPFYAHAIVQGLIVIVAVALVALQKKRRGESFELSGM